MIEKIYTIPVNEAFDECEREPSLGCPFCKLYRKTESDELTAALGAAMMEPDTRIKMNREGFCKRHLDGMFIRENKLSLALILESHSAEVAEELGQDKGIAAALKGGVGQKSLKCLSEREKRCYVCGRVDSTFDKFISNSVYLWESEKDFREKLKRQPYICLPHYKRLLEAGQQELGKKLFSSFYSDLSALVLGYFEQLRGDVTGFTRKFDYRYSGEPWGNAKDAPERMIKFLRGDM